MTSASRSSPSSGQFAIAAVMTCVGLCGVVRADTIYLQERVINSAQPGAPQTPFPSQKLAAYVNSVGFPVECQVAIGYPNAFPGVDCSPSSAPPPLMHRARYPASLAPLAGALFSHSSDWSLDPTGSYADYWNLLYSSNSAGWVYRDQNRYLQFAMLAKHYADDPNVGAYVGYDYKLYYRVSTDGGQSFPAGQQFSPVIASGHTVTQPFPMQQIGRDGGSVPGTAYIGKSITGDVLTTMFITEGPVPPHVTTITNGYVLRGKWNSAGNDVTWNISEPARLPVSQSTRGADEPAVLELSASTTGAVNCIMVARASNEDYSQPTKSVLSMGGHYWLFRSTDGCATWQRDPTRWGFNDGTPFYAPASNSVLIRSSRNNRIYWIGNISAANSEGNWPRTTLVAAEVDVQSATPGLIKDSLVVLDRMQVQDTDRVHINNMELALQPNGSQFVYLRRRDEGCPACTSPLSWYTLDIATQGGVNLSVTPSGTSDHVLYWQAGVSNVLQYHIYRRYLSGEPLSDAWVEVGTLPGTSVGVTLAGYQSWQETEYEVIAELTSGASLKSNRVVTTFPSWQAPRLSFYFSPEPAPGAAVPLGQIVIAWKYDQAPNIWHYRLYRRYFADNGTPTAWSPVGDLERERTSVTLQGYTRTDRFELRLAAVRWNSQEDVSNAIYVRFPTAGDPLRLPY